MLELKILIDLVAIVDLMEIGQGLLVPFYGESALGIVIMLA